MGLFDFIFGGGSTNVTQTNTQKQDITFSPTTNIGIDTTPIAETIGEYSELLIGSYDNLSQNLSESFSGISENLKTQNELSLLSLAAYNPELVFGEQPEKVEFRGGGEQPEQIKIKKSKLLPIMVTGYFIYALSKGKK